MEQKEENVKWVKLRRGVGELISFRLSAKMLEWANDEAKRLDLSRSEFIRVAVQHYLQYGSHCCPNCDERTRTAWRGFG